MVFLSTYCNILTFKKNELNSVKRLKRGKDGLVLFLCAFLTLTDWAPDTLE